MESHRDAKEPSQLHDEDELEQREYSSPACYLHEFEQQASAADEARTAPKSVPDPKAAKPSDTPPETC